MNTTQIKALGNGCYGGYGVLFGSPDQADLEGDFFTSQTDFWLNEVPTSVVVYDHATTPSPADFEQAALEVGRGDRERLAHRAMQIAETKGNPRRHVVGKVTKRQPDERGIWFEFVLDENQEYRGMVEDLLAKGVLSFSTDSMAHYVSRDPAPNNTYWVKSWVMPIISVTHHPAEPRLGGIYPL